VKDIHDAQRQYDEAEAKIRAGAVSNFSVTQLEAYEARRHVGSLEPRSRSSTVPRAAT